jgi:arylsulfatase A-like enzyme
VKQSGIRQSTFLVSAAATCICAGFIAATPAAQQPSPAQGTGRSKPPNILLIIGDDMGVETLRSFGVGADTAATPNLDRLAASGVRFNRYWAQPVCSPTRATMLTGRYGFRTGVGRPTGDGAAMGAMPATPPAPAGSPREGGRGGPAAGGRGRPGGPGAGRGGGGQAGNAEDSPGLRLEEFTLPKAFAAHPELGFATAAIGKWHLSDSRNGWEKHPNAAGFGHFSGGLRGFPEGYFGWIKDVNGALSGRTGYGPSDQVDDATKWIGARGDQPWFLWFAFNLPHAPLHLPPRSLWVTDHSDLDPQADPNANPRPYFKAMVEAMDTEIGRLLASLDPATRANTYVIFMGDNGSTGGTVTAPFVSTRAKGTVYEGGVNTPLMVTGPGVPTNRSSNALVNSADMFATIMEMARIPRTTVPPGPAVDSVSFLPYLSQPDRTSIRQWVYADTFGPPEGFQGGQYAIRNDTHKLVVRAGTEEFYDVANDRSEARNLLGGTLTPEQERALASLRTQVSALHASEPRR